MVGHETPQPLESSRISQLIHLIDRKFQTLVEFLCFFAALLADIPPQPNVTHASFVRVPRLNRRVHAPNADLVFNVRYRFRSPQLLHMDGSSSTQSSADTCRPHSANVNSNSTIYTSMI
jgi:hypothetical protein